MESHQEQLIETLRSNPKAARDYLMTAIRDADTRTLLVALRNVVEARGHTRVCEKMSVPLQGLYRTLSAKGDARLHTLLAVLKATGFRLTRERLSADITGH